MIRVKTNSIIISEKTEERYNKKVKMDQYNNNEDVERYGNKTKSLNQQARIAMKLVEATRVCLQADGVVG